MNDWPQYHPGAYNNALPPSCCYDPQNGGSNQCSAINAFRTNCLFELDKVLKLIIWFLSGILFAAAVTQLVAACFACSVAKAAD